jgi:thiol:disulfide interchange protein DsbA
MQRPPTLARPDRRQVARALGAVGALALLPGLRPLRAQTPIEVQDYVRLDKPVPVALPPGKKLELIEFFWYGCPHCNALEPLLAPWLRRLPADVNFRLVPVGFTARHLPGQRLFYALQAAGLVESLHAKVYHHLHETDGRLDYEWQMTNLVAKHGGDKERFAAALKSPELAQRLKDANALVKAFDVDGVPTFGVHGRFTTSPEQTGGRERCLQVVEWLLQRARTAG